RCVHVSLRELLVDDGEIGAPEPIVPSAPDRQEALQTLELLVYRGAGAAQHAVFRPERRHSSAVGQDDAQTPERARDEQPSRRGHRVPQAFMLQAGVMLCVVMERRLTARGGWSLGRT